MQWHILYTVNFRITWWRGLHNTSWVYDIHSCYSNCCSVSLQLYCNFCVLYLCYLTIAVISLPLFMHQTPEQISSSKKGVAFWCSLYTDFFVNFVSFVIKGKTLKAFCVTFTKIKHSKGFVPALLKCGLHWLFSMPADKDLCLLQE